MRETNAQHIIILINTEAILRQPPLSNEMTNSQEEREHAKPFHSSNDERESW